MDDDEPRTYPVPLRRRTDSERIDYFMGEVAVLSARVNQQEREISDLRKRVRKLEEM